MKKLWKYSLVLILVVVMACNQKKTADEHQHTQQFTCPMHPQIIKNEMGICPICKMDLVPMQQQEVKMEVDADLADLIKPANEVVISNIKTIKVVTSTVSDTLSLNGKVTYNSNHLKRISSRLSGRIEKLYVKYNFQMVSKGQKIMEIYSPEIAAAQQELLYLKNNGETNLLEQTKTKLRLLGVAESEINKVLKSGKVDYKVAVYSPVNGYIIDAKQSLNKSVIATDEMNSSSPTYNTNTNSLGILEGTYVNIGDLLFQLFEPGNVWAEFFVKAQQAEALNTKSKLSIINQNGIKTNAQINLIQPYFTDGQNYKVVRIYLNNKPNFKIGELLKAEVTFDNVSGLWIPAKAVYQLGQKNIVFIKQGNILKPKEIVIATKGKQQFLIKSGLKLGDEIAENASFLVDTESFIEITE
jgi:Cu(I)/Ag(I) efflux system membrane fusion protein